MPVVSIPFRHVPDPCTGCRRLFTAYTGPGLTHRFDCRGRIRTCPPMPHAGVHSRKWRIPGIPSTIILGSCLWTSTLTAERHIDCRANSLHRLPNTGVADMGVAHRHLKAHAAWRPPEAGCHCGPPRIGWDFTLPAAGDIGAFPPVRAADRLGVGPGRAESPPWGRRQGAGIPRSASGAAGKPVRVRCPGGEGA